MRTLVLALVLMVVAGCGGGRREMQRSAETHGRPVLGCRALVGSLGRLAVPGSMSVQRRELSRLSRVAEELLRRFDVRAGKAADEYGASIRAEHESISARRDGRVTASRRLHAQAAVRYGRGGKSARTASSRCPRP